MKKPRIVRETFIHALISDTIDCLILAEKEMRHQSELAEKRGHYVTSSDLLQRAKHCNRILKLMNKGDAK